MGFMSVWMFVGLLVFLALVAGAVYLGIRLTQRDEDDLESAQEVLDRRLASGELSPEQYADRRAAMQNDPPRSG